MVKKALLLTKESPERRRAFLELENKGNFQHNAQVIENGHGELIVTRRPGSNSHRADDFLPCEYCLGFYLKESLWLHVSKCQLKPTDKQPSINFIRNASTLITSFLPKVSDEDLLLDSLFEKMKETTANPGVPVLCKRDNLIREYAKSLMHRLGDETEQRCKDLDNVRTKVRTVGWLLQEINTGQNPCSQEDYITGQGFEQVVTSTISLSRSSDSPQLALVLGHYLKQIALLKISKGIMTGQKDYSQEAREFVELYQAHWNNRVSSVAKRRQKLRHINKPTIIPLTEDLTILKHG